MNSMAAPIKIVGTCVAVFLIAASDVWLQSDPEVELPFAIRAEDVARVQQLLRRLGDLGTIYADDSTLLHYGVRQGNVPIMRLLLQAKIGEAFINRQDREGFAHLHEAVELEKVEIVRLLITHSANVNLPGKADSTPLHYAAYRGNLEIARILLENRANVHATSRSGWTPLRLATEKGKRNGPTMANLLKSYGATH